MLSDDPHAAAWSGQRVGGENAIADLQRVVVRLDVLRVQFAPVAACVTLEVGAALCDAPWGP